MPASLQPARQLVQRYLVGGAVRDQLLGLPVIDKDWVVVGARAEELLALGYRLKDAQFQVYLHPQTGDEHALARTETKAGDGHRGFELEFGPHITLEQDLRRRDLTINAIAQSESGAIVDPFDGRKALHERRLVHVSDAFREDPLRLFRCAQFLARLAPFDFRVETSTLRIMREMASTDDIDRLSDQRVWQETAKALRSDAPGKYFELLFDVGLARRVIHGLDVLAIHAPGAFAQTLSVMNEAARNGTDPETLVALVHVAGALAGAPVEAGTTVFPLNVFNKAAKDAVQVAQRLAVRMTQHQADAASLLTTLTQLDALRRPQRFEAALATVERIAASPLGTASVVQHCGLLRNAARMLRNLPAPATGATGMAAKEAIEQARMQALRELLLSR